MRIERMGRCLLLCWYEGHRSYDIKYMWPAYKREALRNGFTVDDARDVFWTRVHPTPAWSVLSSIEIVRIVKELK
jgi:hypothetical protein